MCAWGGGVVAFASAYRGLPTIIFLVLIVPVALFLTYRLARLSVTCCEDLLVVRNALRTHRVARSHVEGFRVGRKVGQPGTITIYARLRDGTVLPMDVAWQFLYFGRGTPLQDQLRLLQTWLTRSALP